MDTGRLRRGELIGGVSAVLLFIVMFFNWFGVSSEDAADIDVGNLQDLTKFAPTDPNADRLDLSAWQAFSFIDIILVLTILVAVGLAVMTAASQSVNLPVAASAVTAGLGILATVLILFRIFVTPYDLGRDFFVFVGLILAAGIAFGGWQSMKEEGTSFGDQADRMQNRGGTGTGTGGGTPPPPRDTGGSPPPPREPGGPPPPPTA